MSSLLFQEKSNEHRTIVVCANFRKQKLLWFGYQYKLCWVFKNRERQIWRMVNNDFTVMIGAGDRGVRISTWGCRGSAGVAFDASENFDTKNMPCLLFFVENLGRIGWNKAWKIVKSVSHVSRLISVFFVEAHLEIKEIFRAVNVEKHSRWGRGG